MGHAVVFLDSITSVTVHSPGNELYENDTDVRPPQCSGDEAFALVVLDYD